MNTILDVKEVEEITNKSIEELMAYKPVSGKAGQNPKKRVKKLIFSGALLTDVPDPAIDIRSQQNDITITRELSEIDVMVLKLLKVIIKDVKQEIQLKEIGQLLPKAYPSVDAFKVNVHSMGQLVRYSVEKLGFTDRFERSNFAWIRLSPHNINQRIAKIKEGGERESK